MSQEHILRRRLALKGTTACLLASLVLSNPAFSQEQEQEDELADEALETVVVTGSRLNTNSNLIAPNPVLAIDSEEITVRGTVLIEDLTNILPQVFAGQTSEISNGATGTSTVNLRGLGAIRTLTLIDGRRLPFGSPVFAPADVNQVPTQLIERIDVVTGGGSAVYGSDAIGGVVNFILKDDYEGLEFDVQGGFFQAGNQSSFFESILDAGSQPVPGPALDGRQIFASVTMGANTPDGRGNVTLFAQYQNQGAISQDNRIGSACSLAQGSGPESFEGLTCAGSINFRAFNGPGGLSFQEEDGTIVPLILPSIPSQTFNFGPFNFFQRPNERFQIYAKGNYEINDYVEAFGDFSFVNNSSDAQIAPTASFGLSAFSINCDNPLIQDNEGIPLLDVFGCTPEDVAAGNIVDNIGAPHRNVEGGPRNSNNDLTNWRMIGGFRGTVFDNVDYEVFGQFSRVLLTSIDTEDFIVENFQESILLTTDPDTGEVVCTSGNPNCVPYNIFQRGPNGETLVTDEAVDFLTGPSIVTGETQQFIFGGTVQSDLGEYGIKSPFADNGVALLLGGEYRVDSLVSEPDLTTQIEGGGFTGVGGATLPVSGQVRVAEFFLEAQIPVLNGLPLAEDLTISGAYRFSDYATDGAGVTNDFDTSSFFAAVNWTPHEWFRLRGQFQRAVRAPNVIELFTGQNTGLAGLTPTAGFFDPCSGPAPLATFEACANTGVTAAQFGNIADVAAGQTGTITGGNPLLTPEVSDTYTAGLVFTPSFLPNFSLSIDYFDIEVSEVIVGGIPVQIILDSCLDTGDPIFCGLIQRDALGSLNAGLDVGFTQTNTNAATLSTNGIDFQMLYDVDLEDLGLGELGSLSFDYASTYLRSLAFVPFPGATGDAFVDCAGLFAAACDAPLPIVNPQYRHRMLATWNTPWSLTTTFTWRYFSSVDNQSEPGDSVPSLDQTLPSVNYLDFSAQYQATEQVTLRLGINNLTGREAPVTTTLNAPFGNGNTAPAIFDATGRFFFFGINFRI